MAALSLFLNSEELKPLNANPAAHMLPALMKSRRVQFMSYS